jgi:hypothetical protein
MLGLLGGPVGKVLAGIAAAGVIVLAVLLWLHEHDARILAEQAAKAQAVAAAAQFADAKAATEAVAQVAHDAVARAAAQANTRAQIAGAAAPAASCGAPAAVLRAVDAMKAPAP